MFENHLWKSDILSKDAVRPYGITQPEVWTKTVKNELMLVHKIKLTEKVLISNSVNLVLFCDVSVILLFC